MIDSIEKTLARAVGIGLRNVDRSDYPGQAVAQGQRIRECTVCPEDTFQCVHLDGFWVRLMQPRQFDLWRIELYWPAGGYWRFYFADNETADELYNRLNAKLLVSDTPIPDGTVFMEVNNG